MKKLILLLGLLFIGASLPADVNAPLRFDQVNGVPINANTVDYRAGDPLSGPNLELYMAIYTQTGLRSFTVLTSRFEPLPSRIRFSTSGDGCPFGITSYCKKIRYVNKVNGAWVVEKRKK